MHFIIQSTISLAGENNFRSSRSSLTFHQFNQHFQIILHIKYTRNSFNDPKRLPGGSVSPAVNNTVSQQTKNAWQPSTNKEQNLGLLSSVSYVKKEPSDLSTEQQNRPTLVKLSYY